MTYTRFMDMHSGGGLKEEPYDKIFIEAPEEEAKVVFYNRFGHNPERVTCTCCGEDYSMTEGESLAELSAYDRNCATEYFYTDTGEVCKEVQKYGKGTEWDSKRRVRTYKGRVVDSRHVERADLSHMEYGATQAECESRYMPVKDYFEQETVLVIYAEDIEDHERQGTVPVQGYTWID